MLKGLPPNTRIANMERREAYAVDRLANGSHTSDQEENHILADDIVLDFLRECGFTDLSAEWLNVLNPLAKGV